MSKPRPEDAVTYDWYQARLQDVSLLERAVPVPLARGGYDLAVPVRARRRGGYCFACPARAAQAIEAMRARPDDFPDLRWGPEPEMLLWGPDPRDLFRAPGEPGDDSLTPTVSEAAYDRAVGLWYGYSDEAIGRFLRYHDLKEDQA